MHAHSIDDRGARNTQDKKLQYKIYLFTRLLFSLSEAHSRSDLNVTRAVTCSIGFLQLSIHKDLAALN